MLIKFLIHQDLILPAEVYTQNPSKSIRNYVFQHFLFKIIDLGNQSSGICIKIQGIQLINNVILRKTADLKLKIKISLIVIKLVLDQYYEGIISKSIPEGIIVQFFGGLLSGTIPLTNLHKDTLYNEEDNQWILTPGKGLKGYKWQIGNQVGFKIHQTKFSHINREKSFQIDEISTAHLISLKANQPGLGPKQWWI